MSKGSWSRVKDIQAWNNSPIWDKKPTRIIDIIKEYPAETLAYEQGFDIEQYDLPLETHFKSIIEIPIPHIYGIIPEYLSFRDNFMKALAACSL